MTQWFDANCAKQAIWTIQFLNPVGITHQLKETF